jgi:hypothetical protein
MRPLFVSDRIASCIARQASQLRVTRLAKTCHAPAWGLIPEAAGMPASHGLFTRTPACGGGDGDERISVARRDLLQIKALFWVEQNNGGIACLLSSTSRADSFFPGLSRCGVSDDPAPQRGVSRIGQPIRGPDAKRGRQPQRVQPGGFFRPLFGRSKRGHLDGYDQQQESTHMARLSNHREGRRTPSCIPVLRPSSGDDTLWRTSRRLWPMHWPHRQQDGRTRKRRCRPPVLARNLKVESQTLDCDYVIPALIGSFLETEAINLVRMRGCRNTQLAPMSVRLGRDGVPYRRGTTYNSVCLPSR